MKKMAEILRALFKTRECTSKGMLDVWKIAICWHKLIDIFITYEIKAERTFLM
jgi:hypothetical protein